MKPNMHFHELKGHTIREISHGNDEVLITTDNVKLRLMHRQECCESVILDKVIGDTNALVGNVVTFVEDDSVSDSTGYDEKETSTFVIRCGDIEVKFIFEGESNGYYGTGVGVDVID